MKTMKTLLATGIAAAAMAAPAMAELSASAAVSNLYLFRGVDQDPGNAAVSGDITYSTGGFYASAWASSSGGSEEVDLILGWGGEFGGVGVDVGAISYYYPGLAPYDSGNELVEAYLGLSFAGVEFYYYDNVTGKNVGDSNSFGVYGDDGFVYYTLGYSMGKWSALLGMADPDEAKGQSWDNDYTHLDISYAFNDNLSFTVSKVIDLDDEINANTSFSGAIDDDVNLVVSYSIPLK